MSDIQYQLKEGVELLGRFGPNQRDAWLQARQSGIGGSDIASILGLSQWGSPLSVWQSKREIVEVEENEYMRAGRMLEPIVVSYFVDQTQLATIEPDNAIYRRIDTPYLCTPDRFIVYDANEFGVLECKTTQQYITAPDIPLSWLCQLQWTLMVCNEKRGALAWLRNGVYFDYMEMERDEEFCDMMVERAREFWVEYVLPGIPPAPINDTDVKALYPVSLAGTSIEATDAMLEAWQRLVTLRAEIAKLEHDKSAEEEALKMYMQNNETLTFEGQVLSVWKSTKGSRRFDEKRFKEEHPDLYSQYIKEQPRSRRFTIKG